MAAASRSVGERTQTGGRLANGRLPSNAPQPAVDAADAVGDQRVVCRCGSPVRLVRCRNAAASPPGSASAHCTETDFGALKYLADPRVVGELSGVQTDEAEHPDTLERRVILYLRQTPDTEQVGFAMPQRSLTSSPMS